MRNFDEFAEGEILKSMSIYLLDRPIKEVPSEGQNQPAIEQFEIRVLQYLNGERKGQFKAAPYLAFKWAAKEFIGEGQTNEQALMDALGRIKGVPYERIFPQRNT